MIDGLGDRSIPNAPPPDPEAMRQADLREGFFEQAYKQAVEDITRMGQEIDQLRATVQAIEAQSNAWHLLALRYGTDLSAEWRRASDSLHGNVAVAGAILAESKGEAIEFACRNLVNKMRAELRR